MERQIKTFKGGTTMRQHIIYFSVFISIIGLMSISTVDAAEITEYFDSDPGWTSFNLPVDNNDFGFRNSNFAGGNTGEAGGFFSRTEQIAWYGDDTIGNLTGNQILSASGLMNIYNEDPSYDAGIHIGHCDSSGPVYTNGIGFNSIGIKINEEGVVSYKIAVTEGFLFYITGIDESRTWSYLYNPYDSSYGSLTVSISGSGGNTATVFLSESQRSSIGTLNTFGLASGGESPRFAPGQREFYIDNVSYTVDSTSELTYTPVNPCRIVDTRKTSAGMIGANTERDFHVFGNSSTISAQGGNPFGCPSPLDDPHAVHINMVAVNPTGKGNLQAFPQGAGTGAGLWAPPC
jgi:hypothetical protein